MQPESQTAIEYCLLWIDWWPMCMSKAEWSSWVQALGSLIGLAVAITVPLAIRNLEQKARAEEELHIARILGPSLLNNIAMIIGAANAIRKHIEAHHEGKVDVLDPRTFAPSLDMLAIPSAVDISNMRPAGFNVGANLSLGASRLDQGRQAMKTVSIAANIALNPSCTKLVAALGPIFDDVVRYFTTAEQEISAFLEQTNPKPVIEGQQNKVA